MSLFFKDKDVNFELRHLQKRLSSKTRTMTIRVDHVAVERGDCFAVIGENGTGKTCFLRVLAGSLKPDSGKLNLPKPVIAFTHIERQLHYRLTILENIRYLAAIFGGKINLVDIEKNSKSVGLEDMLSHTVAKLSKGQKTRLVLLLLNCFSWKTIILDEPTLGLDDDGLHIFAKTIKQVRRKGSIVFISSHDIEMLQRVSNKVLTVGQNGFIELSDFSEVVHHCAFEIVYYDGSTETVDAETLKGYFLSGKKPFLKISKSGVLLGTKIGN